MRWPTTLLLSLLVVAAPFIKAESKQADTAHSLVSGVLDDLHSAAAAANFKRYFSHYAANAVFFGTDPGERWPLETFKKYTKARFDQGNGWRYRATSRNIYFSVDGNTSWFDEVLFNDKYGYSRGTGVLLLQQGHWKVIQYHLTIPIPNELAYDFVEKILEHERR